MQKDNAQTSESITIEETDIDTTIEGYLDEMRKLAKSENTKQTKVLAAGTLEEGEGERVLTVLPSGKHTVTFKEKK